MQPTYIPRQTYIHGSSGLSSPCSSKYASVLVSTKDLAFESVLLLALGAYATSLIRQDLVLVALCLRSYKDRTLFLIFIPHFLFPLARRASWHAYYDETSQVLTSSKASL